MNYLRHAGINSNRGISAGLWRDAPIDEVVRGYKDGVYFADDFTQGGPILATAASAVGVVGEYRGFTSDGGVIGDAGLYGGALELYADGDNEGASCQSAVAPFQIALTKGDLWFEARVKVAAIVDAKKGFLLGLGAASALAAAVPITAAGALANINFVGFQNVEDDGKTVDVLYKADGVNAVVLAEALITLAADTWIKLGLRYRTKTGKLSYFVNGVEQSATYSLITTAGNPFPNDVALAPTFAMLNGAAEANKVNIDWMRCLQLDFNE